MNLKQYFTPQRIKTFSSKFNSKIEVVKFSGKLRLDMGDLTQSGQVIEKIWKKTFKKLLPKNFSPKSILILGFGAGSVAHVISNKWPQVSITGIEIDTVVIKLAKEHFQINKIPNLKIINTDAVNFVKKLSKNYDLILVDCYLGDQFPKKLEALSFYKNLTSHSKHIIINRLFWRQHQQPSLQFKEKLAKHFSVTTTRTPSNFLIHLG